MDDPHELIGSTRSPFGPQHAPPATSSGSERNGRCLKIAGQFEHRGVLARKRSVSVGHCSQYEQLKGVCGWVWLQPDDQQTVRTDQRQRARIVALFRKLAGP
jgi:hypothetical protein